MNDNIDAATNKRNIWVRGFFMLLMVFIFQLVVTVMFVITVLQFILMLLDDTPNTRLVTLARNLARFMLQIVYFLTFVSEEIPYPFSDWPAID